jgi:ligand-binding sensor domain-containing protein
MDDRAEWETYTVANTNGGLPNDWVYGLAEGKGGEVWIATEGGLARFAEGRWSHWSHQDGLGADYDLVKGEITFRNDPGQASSHHAMQKKEQGLSGVDIAYHPNYVISIAVGDDGRVWAGTWGGGLSVFDGTSFKTYTRKDGLPANHVFMLRKDGQGALWAGTSQGLAKFDGQAFTRFGTEDGLYSDNVFSMAFTDKGEAWVGSFGGITRFPGVPRKHAAN